MFCFHPHHPGHDLLQASASPSSCKTGSELSEVHLNQDTNSREKNTHEKKTVMSINDNVQNAVHLTARVSLGARRKRLTATIWLNDHLVF